VKGGCSASGSALHVMLLLENSIQTFLYSMGCAAAIVSEHYMDITTTIEDNRCRRERFGQKHVGAAVQSVGREGAAAQRVFARALLAHCPRMGSLCSHDCKRVDQWVTLATRYVLGSGQPAVHICSQLLHERLPHQRLLGRGCDHERDRPRDRGPERGRTSLGGMSDALIVRAILSQRYLWDRRPG
jgi:hypothetical protein